MTESGFPTPTSYMVNAVIDAAYASMKSGRWEQVQLNPDIVGS